MKSNFIILLFISTLLIMGGCVKETKKTTTPGYWDLPTSHTMPSNEQERHEECARIRKEMASVQSRADFADGFSSGFVSATLKSGARQDMAALESRAAEVACISSFSNRPATKEMSFDECFKKCKEYTNRSNEGCFDSCNK